MPRLARPVAACALALSVGVAGLARAAVAVEVSGQDRSVVRLVDPATHATLARDRLRGEPVQDSLVSAGNDVVAVRHGAADGGDGLAAYAIAGTPAPASGATAGRVARVLAYDPRDGHLDVSLQQVPSGVVLRVRTGRHPPYWNKVFLHVSAGDTWYEWPRALEPGDPTEGMPTKVGEREPRTPYAAWLRPLDPQGD